MIQSGLLFVLITVTKKDKLELKITFLRRNCCHLSDKKNVHMYMYLQKKTNKLKLLQFRPDYISEYLLDF